MQAATLFRSLLVLFWLALAFGCAQTPPRPAGPTASDPDVIRAGELLAAGQYLRAMDAYRQLVARSVTPQQRAGFLISVADAARLGGDWDSVRATLEELAALPLDADQVLLLHLLQTEVLLQERRAEDALAALGNAPPETTPSGVQIRYFDDLAAAYRQLGNLLETANALQAVDALQSDPNERLQTQTEILRSLALLNEQILTSLQPSPPGTAGGWMELALLVKRYGHEPAELNTRFAAWRQQFPDHPALPELLVSYRDQLQGQMQQFSHIAVLLPQSGPLAGVAAAIRDGIVISLFEIPSTRRPELRFYDASDEAGIWPLYNEAVAAGAEIVIGPLQKESVAQLLRAGELPVPVLALNQVEIETRPTSNLFMYSLSPEDEARQVAERIWLDGHRHPVVLVPQGSWGERVAAAFEARWSSLGGLVAGVAQYDEQSHDYTDPITQVLQLDQSAERHRQLQGILGRKLEFEPSRRADADAVFMAARPVQAQGMRPQLQFHHAADLPVYATSHAWLGALAPNQVEDMKGILLADIPWLVTASGGGETDRASVAQVLPNSGTAYARLYAMGMDALRLVPHLRRLQSSRYEALDGSTGSLYMDELNQIHRQLVWVRLDAEPEILGFAPRMDLQGDALSGEPTVQAIDGSVTRP